MAISIKASRKDRTKTIAPQQPPVEPVVPQLLLLSSLRSMDVIPIIHDGRLALWHLHGGSIPPAATQLARTNKTQLLDEMLLDPTLTPARKAGVLLYKQGWFAIEATIETEPEIVVILKDPAVRLPFRYQSPKHAKYTLAECQQMVRNQVTREQLRQIHSIKQEFPHAAVVE